jgi:hypothetical protein
MFAVYNYEVSENIYIFDSITEAQKCGCLLNELSSYNDNAKDCYLTFVEQFDSYEAIKNSQIEILGGCCEGGSVILIYNGKTEIIDI